MDEVLLISICVLGGLFLFGLIFLIIGLAVLKNLKRKIVNCTSKTYGKVINLQNRVHRSNGNYSSTWHPVFEYSIGDLKFIKESNCGHSQSQFAIGETVEIYFNPENYHEFYVPNETIQKTLGVIFTIVGSVIIFIVISILVIYLLFNKF